MEPRRKSRKKAAKKSSFSATKGSPSSSKKPGRSAPQDGFLDPRQYQVFFHKARDAMFVADVRTRRIVDVNLSGIRLMGYSRKKMLTMKADELHPEEVWAETMAGFKQHAQGFRGEVISQVLTAKGKKIPVGIRTSRVEIDGKMYLLGIFRDISRSQQEAERLQRSEMKSNMLSQASLTLLRITEPLKRYHYLLDHILKASGSRYGFIGYIDPGTGYLVAPTMTEEIWEECRMHEKDFVLKDCKGLWGWVLKHREVVCTNDPPKDPRHFRQPKGHIRIENFLGVPCVSKGKVVGMVALANREGGFSKFEEDLVMGYAKLVTVAILDHYKLMERTRTEEVLQQHRKMQNNLLAISRKLPLCRDLTEAWRAACEPINQTIDAMASSLYIPNREKTSFRVIDSRRIQDPLLQGRLQEVTMPIVEKSIVGRVYHTQKMVAVSDTETDPRLLQCEELTLIGGYRSIVAVPLVYETACFGVALFFFEKARKFRKEEINLIRLALNQLSPSLVKIEYDRKIRESENRFRSLVEKNLAGVYLIQDGLFQYVNPRLAEIFGYDPEELIGKRGPKDLTDPADRSLVEKNLRRRLTGEVASVQYSFRGKKKGGELFSVEAIGNRIDYRGRPAILGTLLDVTARKQAEEAVLQVARGVSAQVGETFFRSIVEHLGRMLKTDVAYVGERDRDRPGWIRTRAVYAGGEIVDNFEYDLAGTPCEGVVGKDVRTYPDEVGKLFPDDALLAEMEIAAYSGIPLFNASGGALGLLVVLYRKPLKDVAMVESMLKIFAARTAAELEREQSEQALQDSQERLKVVFDSLDAIIYVTDIFSHEILFLNRYARRIFGEVTGKLCWQVMQKNRRGPCDFCANKKLVTAEGEPGEVLQWEFKNTLNDRWYEIRDRAIRWIDGRLVRLEIAVDITERKEAEQALTESEEKFRRIFEDSPIGILHTDGQGVITACNRTFAEIVGVPRDVIRGFPLSRAVENEEMKAAVMKALAGGKGHFEGKYTSVLGGRETYLKADFAPIFSREEEVIGLIGLYEDASERKRLEEELARAQRLEAAGRVAGQIAHDFNNLLSPLMAYPDLLRMECRGTEAMLPLLDSMQSVAIQMSEINQQLLTLGRRGHYNLSRVDLNRLLDKILGAFPLPETIVLQKELAEDLLPIRGGEAQISRALMNLITNAVEAMDEIGTLTVSTRNVYLDQPLKGYETVERGEYAQVDIVDTGAGIDPQILDKIFDPFFSTKKADRKRGSGLGLSVVGAVLEDHYGYIGVESSSGRGSLFSLYFPITRDVEAGEEADGQDVPGGEERILVVDDDPVQREVLQHLLGQLGYEVDAVESGEAATNYVREHPQDLLLLDMVMDGIDGTETFRRIRTFYPEQKAVVLSGYAESNRVVEALHAGAGAFVRKPVDLPTLAQAVRKELDR